MTTMSDLPEDLVEEIFSRVPLTCLRSVRCTYKKWNALSKIQIFGKKAEAAAARKQFMGFMIMDYKVCSLRFDLQGIQNDDFIEPSIKQVSKLDKIEITQLFHCDGLLLCVVKDNKGLMVCNPYLGQTRWIQRRTNYNGINDRYALGYDKNRNHKVLRISELYQGRYQLFRYKIYNLSSNLWKFLNVKTEWEIESHRRGVSLKGNTYFPAEKRETVGGVVKKNIEHVLVCFDFTSERFGPGLPMPFNSYDADIFVSLSCVREEQLAMLYQKTWETSETIEIFVTNKIDPNAVSWSKFLIIFSGFPVDIFSGSFFIDEKKKVAVVFDLDRFERTQTCRYNTAYIIGQDEYLKSVNMGLVANSGTPDIYGCTPQFCYVPLVSSSYVPSLVQLQKK